jgi:hypothetical protein
MMVAFAMTVANAMALAAMTIDGASLRAFLILNLPQSFCVIGAERADHGDRQQGCQNSCPVKL